MFQVLVQVPDVDIPSPVRKTGEASRWMMRCENGWKPGKGGRTAHREILCQTNSPDFAKVAADVLAFFFDFTPQSSGTLTKKRRR